MATRISNAAALAACNAIVDLLDVGGAGSVEIFTGAAPTNVEDAQTGTLLAQLTCSATAFGNAADANPGATATANTVTGDSSANNTGTAGYFRAKNNAGTAVIQGTCGTSAADMILNSVSIQSGVAVDITAWTFTVPET